MNLVKNKSLMGKTLNGCTMSSMLALKYGHLDVELSNTDEQVNVDHEVTITYNDEESNPNPLPTESSE